MNIREDFTCFNIRKFLQSDKAVPVGKENLTDILSDFICPQNLDVETFLRKNAVGGMVVFPEAEDNEKLQLIPG